MKKNTTILLILLLTGSLLLSACQDSTIKASYFNARDDASEKAADEVVNDNTNCSALNPHPMAESIVEQFEVAYEQVMTWYCDGYAFSDILLALETAKLVDQDVPDLLSLL